MGGAIVSRLIVLVGGMLYPAYGSYKAVKSANVRQYVRWMMYWVVFALFTTVETFTDIFLSWMPFYYEIKVGFVIWLLSPYTKGAAFLYRKFVHPMLARREPEIDNFLTSAKERSYATMLDVGSRGINVAANAVVTAAVKGQAVMSDRLKSYSVNDISRLSDETPIHSMNPGLYNPQIQREIPRRTEATRLNIEAREPMQIQHHEQVNPMNTDAYDARFTETDGLVIRDIPDGTGDYAYIGYQNKAYSMMNLSQTTQGSETIMTRRIEYTSAPPETTVDDSVIPDHHGRSSEDERSYGTLPRQRRKKKRDEESTSVRRSKRKVKAQSYHEPGMDERDFQ